MEEQSYSTGEFGISIHEAQDGWTWVIWLGDEEVDMGWNTIFEQAEEDAALALQEFMDELFEQMTADAE